MWVCMHVCTYVCMYIYVYIYVYILDLLDGEPLPRMNSSNLGYHHKASECDEEALSLLALLVQKYRY
jgi:hypothetical protein